MDMVFIFNFFACMYVRCRVSELRIVELLDDLCDKMQDYTLQKVDNEAAQLF